MLVIASLTAMYEAGLKRTSTTDRHVVVGIGCRGVVDKE